MKKSNKIGWQKYEDYIEKQMSSPFLTNMIKTIISKKMEQMSEDEIEDFNEEEDLEDYEDEEDINDAKSLIESSTMLPLTPQLIDDISLISSFDCWIGHTNFDITNSIKEKLDKMDGVEVLKVWSRYRFFIGIGQMFDFTEVRNNIEKMLIKGD
jgi:hypothetical protein